MIGPWERPSGFRVAPRTHEQIRVAARRSRSLLEINGANVDMIDLLENKLRKIGIHFHQVESDRIPGDVARAIPEKGLILITKEAHDAIHDEDPTYWLLVPHEFAHFALKHAATFARSISNKPHLSIEDSEAQADRFSHEFAMPVGLVQRYCRSVEQIQEAFNVSRQDAEIRQYVLRLEGAINW